MFCPNCGKGEQTPDNYCRNCGEFLADFTGNASLLNRLLGANTPDKRVAIGLVFDALTLIFSALLLVFLFGYFDGRFARTGESAPPIIYLVYLFLGLVAVWQFLSLAIGISHKSKLGGRKNVESTPPPPVETNQNAAASEPAAVIDYLPPADTANLVTPPGVTEDTTRHLDKIPRK